MDLLASLPALPANSDARKLVLKHAWELHTRGLSECYHLVHYREADLNCVDGVSSDSVYLCLVVRAMYCSQWLWPSLALASTEVVTEAKRDLSGNRKYLVKL